MSETSVEIFTKMPSDNIKDVISSSFSGNDEVIMEELGKESIEEKYEILDEEDNKSINESDDEGYYEDMFLYYEEEYFARPFSYQLGKLTFRPKKRAKRRKQNRKFVRSWKMKQEEKRLENIEFEISKKKANIHARWAHALPTILPWERKQEYNDDVNFEEDDIELQLAIQASLADSHVAPCGIEWSLINDLQTRELTPEDYELLLRLDEKVEKKVLTKDQIEKFPTFSSTGSEQDDCQICFSNFESDDILRGLPCGHAFHCECIDQWLTTSSTKCPTCRLDLL